MIRIDAIWMSSAPCDMRSGMDTLMNQIITLCGNVQPHHAWLFANRSANRMKVIVHDGFGIWMCSRRLHKGSFNWIRSAHGGIDPAASLSLSTEQLNALLVGLPWQQLEKHYNINCL